MPLLKMARISILVFSVCLHIIAAVKVKVVMHSEQEDSKMEDEDIVHTESWVHKKRLEVTMLPFLKARNKHVATPNVIEERDKIEFEDEKVTTEKSKQHHPNEMIFPLIYRQSHVNNMFKYGENWYTWSTEKRSDGSKATNYYICYEEPKRCDDVGWERTDTLPKCAFQIDSLLPDDRACINPFGMEPHLGNTCDGGEQMKVAELIRACGPRIRSLWRFVRVGRRPVNVAKPADVNSLICEDEEECFVTIEYRIHHDRITFSLHEPTRGQTFKSVLKREVPEEEKPTPATERPISHSGHKNKHVREEEPRSNKKIHVRSKSKAEGKGVMKERNDSGAFATRRLVKNKIKIREDISEDMSE